MAKAVAAGKIYLRSCRLRFEIDLQGSSVMTSSNLRNAAFLHGAEHIIANRNAALRAQMSGFSLFVADLVLKSWRGMDHFSSFKPVQA